MTIEDILSEAYRIKLKYLFCQETIEKLNYEISRYKIQLELGEASHQELIKDHSKLHSEFDA